ncbi:hypothetical protein DFP72DRAFT_515262 [Ephemerocybe angulata]|uniref:Acylamino-acid-releasing enzyme N-terminal domain-containing protein n=1 Tax=Ephemerocybe angulata TaxID=980116 RepID=A0A8H6HPN3_9AGAR|nr:hypothetical protein DFP72DRAFT_515262 [Tulosesus angulatus]
MEDDPYAKFRFKADLGEGLSGKRRPTAFIVHWDKDDVPSVSRIETPEQLYLGQYIFSRDPENRLYAAAYERQSDWRLLGVKGCFNRPRGIWQVDLAKEAAYPEVWKCTLTKLTDSHLSCRSPPLKIWHDSGATREQSQIEKYPACTASYQHRQPARTQVPGPGLTHPIHASCNVDICVAMPSLIDVV